MSKEKIFENEDDDLVPDNDDYAERFNVDLSDYPLLNAVICSGDDNLLSTIEGILEKIVDIVNE